MKQRAGGERPDGQSDQSGHQPLEVAAAEQRQQQHGEDGRQADDGDEQHAVAPDFGGRGAAAPLRRLLLRQPRQTAGLLTLMQQRRT